MTDHSENTIPLSNQGGPTGFIVLHDRDNTLVTENVTFHAYQKILGDNGVNVPLDELSRNYAGRRFESALKDLEEKHHITIGDSAIVDDRLRYQHAYEEAVAVVQAEHLQAMPGVRATLALFHEAGVPQVIVTNNSARVTAEGNALLGLDRFIPGDKVYSGDDIWKQHPGASVAELTAGEKGFKPAPDLYRMALAGKDVSAALAIAVEDSISGITAAKAAGIGTIVFNRAAAIAESDPARLEAYTQSALAAGATHVIDDYTGLVEIVAERAPPAIQRALNEIALQSCTAVHGGGQIDRNAARGTSQRGAA